MFIIRNQEELNNLDRELLRNVDEIKILNVNYIPEGKFFGFEKLNSIVIEKVNIVEPTAFMNCKNLVTVNFKEKPKEIMDYAFYNTNVGFISELYNETIFGINNNVDKNITLENTSWSDINKLCKLNKSEKYFEIGDEKVIKIKNDFHVIQIYDFNHDFLLDDVNTANITFGFRFLFNKESCMNPAKNSKSPGSNVGDWAMSDLREYLNMEFFDELPDELRYLIKDVNKVTDITPYNRCITTDKVFIPSLQEVGFKPSVMNIHNFIYNIFAFNNDNRSKFCLTPEKLIDTWWLRTSFNENKRDFYYINHSGNYSIYDASYTKGILPCFCV